MVSRISVENEWSLSSPLHNKLSVEDRPIHAWYRFVLSFPPHIVRNYFDDFCITTDHTILDPFCGTGTTLVEAKKNSIPSLGIEANPMALLASKVKVDLSVDPKLLLQEAEHIFGIAKDQLIKDGLYAYAVLDRKIVEQPSLYGLLDLNEVQRNLILTNSISDLPLHKTLVIKKLIEASNPSVRNHLLLALAWSLVNGIGNLRFGPEVGVTAKKLDADVLNIWFSQVERMSHDIQNNNHLASVPAMVYKGDSRAVPDEIPNQSVDFVFTSPPYPNEKDYTRTTRLESVILGLISSKAELRSLKESLIRSNTRNIYVNDDDDKNVQNIKEIQILAEQIEERRIELGKTSGFERLYHKVAKHYFGGMALHFREMRRILKPGAKLGYVVGDQASYLRVMIRTGNLIGQIAEQEGYVVERIDLFRTRIATATSEQLREEVVVLRWPGE